jgi:hypothetical protein
MRKNGRFKDVVRIRNEMTQLLDVNSPDFSPGTVNRRKEGGRGRLRNTRWVVVLEVGLKAVEALRELPRAGLLGAGVCWRSRWGLRDLLAMWDIAS